MKQSGTVKVSAELRGVPVVASDTGETLGEVLDAVLQPTTGALTASRGTTPHSPAYTLSACAIMRRLTPHLRRFALALTALRLGTRIAMSKAMIAMTTSNSIRVNALAFRRCLMSHSQLAKRLKNIHPHMTPDAATW